MSSQVQRVLASDPAPPVTGTSGAYSGEPTLTPRGRQRIDAKAPSNFRTYRCCFSVVAAGAGDFAELRGAAGARGWATRVTIFKPSAGVTIDIIKRTAQDTGGTPDAPPAIMYNQTSDGAPTFAVQTYAAGVPSAGATTGGGGNAYPSAAMATTDVLTADFGEHDGKPVGIAATESLALKTSGAATIKGMIEWMEETV